VAAVARGHVRCTDGPTDLVADHSQHGVAALMPELVVQLLEPVEIEEEHGELIATALAALGLMRQPLLQRPVTRQPRERVGARVPRGMVGTRCEPGNTLPQGSATHRRRLRKPLARWVAARAAVPRLAIRSGANRSQDRLRRRLIRLLFPPVE